MTICRRLALSVACLMALVACSGGRQNDSDRFRADEDGARQAAEWFHNQRAFPGATIPVGARLAALADVRRKWPNFTRAAQSLARPNGIVASATATTIPWVAAGPAPIVNGGAASGVFDVSGRINAIAVDPTNA